MYGLLTTVDGDPLTVQVGCTLRCQEADDLAHLVRLCQTLGGVVCHGFLDMLGNSKEHLGLCSAGSDAVDGDTLGSAFHCQCSGKADHSGLGSYVVALTGVATDSVGAHVDDTTVAVLTHLLVNGLSPVENTVQVDIHYLTPLVGGHLVEDSVTGDGSVIYQNVNAAETSRDLLDGGSDLVGLGNVALHGEINLTQLLSHLASGFVVIVDDGDTGYILPYKDPGGSGTDAAGRTGNNSKFITKHISFTYPFYSGRSRPTRLL